MRVGNASGFYGDRFGAFEEMLGGGPLDVLTGDYLAELTMLILGRDRLKDPKAGYAKTFLKQLEGTLGSALDRGVKIVTNAGGLNPEGLTFAMFELAERLGLRPKIGYVTGDSLEPGDALTANAYLGAWGIAECLRAGADIVVTGRVTDASLVVGPAAAHFGWSRSDFDALAGATVAGHVLECGAQATGGNYSFFTEIPMGRLGFPIAEIEADGSCVITKHDGTGGAVTVGTVTAQLLYEIDGPRYLGPDVVTRFDSISLQQVGPDRVSVSGVRGEPPSGSVKVGLNHLAGYREEVTFVLAGLDIPAKRELVLSQLPSDVQWTMVGDSLLRVVRTSPTPGRVLSTAAVELALSSYPGFTLTAPPSDPKPYGRFESTLVDASLVEHIAVLPDGTRVPIPPTPPGPVEPLPSVSLPQWTAGGPTTPAPLGSIAGARSGDKGTTANIGVWARDPSVWPWLANFLTVERFRELLPTSHNVVRHVLPNLRALNFVIDGILSPTRFDPQGKTLAEHLRTHPVPLPTLLLPADHELKSMFGGASSH
uniref:acyclic terpene utilization AtuA family protein n=1 Tax=Allorhizocola rhizosphaerae TaxID=1872709 RepID=UPI0013C2D0D0